MTKDEQIKSLQDSVWQLNYNLNILASVVADLCCIVPTDTSWLSKRVNGMADRAQDIGQGNDNIYSMDSKYIYGREQRVTVFDK